MEMSSEQAVFLAEVEERMRNHTPPPVDDEHNAKMVAAAMDHYAETGVLLADDGSARETK